MIRGHHAAKWQHEFKIYHKVNTYILYTSKIKPVKPLRYEMMGYDTLLSSYYDHYVLDYEMFEPWHFNYTTLQIPTGKPLQSYRLFLVEDVLCVLFVIKQWGV